MISANLAPVAKQRFGWYADGSQILLGAQRFRGIGVNHWGAFVSQVANLGLVDDYAADMAAIKGTYGLPFIRVSFGMFSRASFVSAYWGNQAEFWGELDAFVAAAESNRLGLVVALTWNLKEWCDSLYDVTGVYCPLRTLAYPDSLAWDKWAEYLAAFVTRYKNSPSIWAWETANEAATKCGPEYWPTWAIDASYASWIDFGTRPDNNQARSRYDKFTMAEYHAFNRRTIGLIKYLDPSKRLVLAGGALGAQMAAGVQGADTLSSDTQAHWNGTTATEGIPWVVYRDKYHDAVTMHIYPQGMSNGRFFAGGERTASDLITLCRGWCDSQHIPFILEETGATYHGDTTDESSVNLETEQANFNAILATVKLQTDVSAWWNYGGDLVGDSPWKRWALKAPARTYQLTALASANAEIALGQEQ